MLGLKLREQQLNELREDQIGQLFELFQEIQKPSSTAEDGTRSDSQTTDGGNKSPLADEDGSRSNLSADDKVQGDDGDTKLQPSPSVNDR